LGFGSLHPTYKLGYTLGMLGYVPLHPTYKLQTQEVARV
jgi:hypothetical protein